MIGKILSAKEIQAELEATCLFTNVRYLHQEELLARTVPKVSQRFSDGREFYFEWMISRNREPDSQIKQFLPSPNYIFLFRRQVIRYQDGKTSPEYWILHDKSDSPWKAVIRDGSSSYHNAESLSPLHVHLKQVMTKLAILQTKQNQMDNFINSGDRLNPSPIMIKWQNEYESELKRLRLYSKVKVNKAPEAIINPLRERMRLGFNSEMEAYRQGIKEVKTEIDRLWSGEDAPKSLLEIEVAHA